MSGKNDIEVILQAKDEATATLNKVKDGLNNIGSATQKAQANFAAAEAAAGRYYDKHGRLHEANGRYAKMSDELGSALQKNNMRFNDLAQSANGLSGIFRNAVGFAAGIAGFQGITAAINGSVGAIFGFSKAMEVNETGIAGILLSMTELDGRAMTWGESLKLSKNIMAQLNSEAMRTAATTEELTNAFRGILGPGLNAGMTIDQMIKLTSAGANAVKSIIPGNAAAQMQIVQELRDLVAGGIQPASSTLATALGLKDSDIQKAKESADGLYNFLMERLKGFETSAPYYAKTFTGLWDQIKEGFTLAGAQGTEGLFNSAKQELDELAGYVVKFNEASNKMEVNPEIVASFTSISEVIADAGHGLSMFAQTASKVVSPAVSVLGETIKIAAKNAELLAYAGVSWYALGKASAAATTLQKFWAGAVTQTTEQYALQAAAAQSASSSAVAGAAKAAAAQQAVTAAVGQTAAAHSQAGAAANASSVTTVTSLAVAKTASLNFLSGLKAMAGGWLGVALATGYAIKALYDYFDAKGKVESYNPKAEVYEENGKLYKKAWTTQDIETTDELGNAIKAQGVGWGRVELSADEYQEHEKWRAWKQEMENKKPWDTEALGNITAKFNTGSGDVGSSGIAANTVENELRKVTEKIGSAFDDLNVQIMEKTQSTYALGTQKLKAEVDKIQREVVDRATNIGVDTSALQSKMKEYAEVMGNELKRVRDNSLKDLLLDMQTMTAKLYDDAVLTARAKYDTELEKIKRKYIELKREFGEAVAGQYQMLAMQSADKDLNESTTLSGALTKGLSEAKTEWGDYYKQIAAASKDAAKEMTAGFTDFFFDMLTGKLKSFSDYFKGFVNSILKSISQLLANQLTQKLLGGVLGMFGGGGGSGNLLGSVSAGGLGNFGLDLGSAVVLPGFASGGRVRRGTTFIAGERGPELISLDGAGASITSSGTTASKRAGCPVTVNVINNTGAQAEVSQDVKFDGDNYIITVVMDAVSRNKNGMRSMIAALR